MEPMPVLRPPSPPRKGPREKAGGMAGGSRFLLEGGSGGEDSPDEGEREDPWKMSSRNEDRVRHEGAGLRKGEEEGS